jgi:2-succinyl-6-hydroxy-2,4-cyclohexadiene-1-carboxylate synthase
MLTAGDPNRPCLLLLHGFLGCKEDFLPLLPQLAENFYCIAIDLPGHGALVGQRRSWLELAQELVGMRDRYGANQPSYLYGYSLGGRIALYAALHFPGVWCKVVLASASAGLAAEAVRQERWRRDGAIARKLRRTDLNFEEFLRAWYAQDIFQGLEAWDGFGEMLDRRKTGDPRSLADALEDFSLGHQPYLGKLLAQSSLPILLLAGELDFKFLEIQRQLLTLCPWAKLQIFPSCSHNLQAQNSAGVVEAIAPWLQS